MSADVPEADAVARLAAQAGEWLGQPPTLPAAPPVEPRAHLPVLTEPIPVEPVTAEWSETRPRTRSECAGRPRPCPWVGCRHHLLAHETRYGSLSINPAVPMPANLPRTLDNHAVSPFVEQQWLDAAVAALDALPVSCALDVADAGECSGEDVGAIMGITRERVRQIGNDGMDKMRAALATAR